MTISQGGKPFFSICIPQHNRVPYLLEAIRVVGEQTFRNFEICISDDHSPERGEQAVADLCREADLNLVYIRQKTNVRYDGNLRAAIGLARGRYCLLHGNDDCLASPDTLQRLYEVIEEHGFPEVIVTNFEDWATGALTKRVPATELVGSGPAVAVAAYRNVAFVTGVVLDRRGAQAAATDRWDGSEMYQMYLMARMVASGGRLLQVSDSLIRKDIQIPGEAVDSYRRQRGPDDSVLRERRLPLLQIARLVSDAVTPFVAADERGVVVERIVRPLYSYTYPFWLVDYRDAKSFRFALGLAWGMRPKNVFSGLPLTFGGAVRLRLLYGFTVLGGLLTPRRLFRVLQPLLYGLAKRSKTRRRSPGRAA